MALNKAQSKAWVKGVIIFVILAFVMTLGGVFVQLSQTPAPPAGTTQQQGTAGGTTATLDQIAAQVRPGIDVNEQKLKTDPKNYDTLKTLGDAYFDWAQQIRTQVQNANDKATWQRSAEYYKQALAIKKGDPAVATDYAIATFYSGDVNGAITIVEEVMKANPTFAQAQLNAGIFYRTANINDKAGAAWKKYLELDPNGQNAANVKQWLEELKTASSSQPASGTTTAP
jgi:Flp pilus assembly protein TadD